MKLLTTISLFIVAHFPVHAQHEAHRGGSNDGYASATYSKTSSIHRASFSSQIVIQNKVIYNHNQTTPCLIYIADILGRQIYTGNIPPSSIQSIPNNLVPPFIIKMVVGDEQEIRFYQP